MPTAELNDTPSNLLLRLLVPILDSQLTTLVSTCWQLGMRLLRANAHEGIYEVLSHTITLDLCDEQGQQAKYTKQQKVRFLQDNIWAYQDQAWGDGNLFAEYRCSPGIPVDRYKEGGRYRILISLREVKKAGDIEEFQIERTITDGFMNTCELLATTIDHRTRWLSLNVIFPATRPPETLLLLERNSTRHMALSPTHRHTLPNGRVHVTWSTHHPHLFETYMVRWTW